MDTALSSSIAAHAPAKAPLQQPDIVVVGGGMAGIMAALAAKCPSNRVLIIEPTNVLGGQGTAGGVAGFCGDTARVNVEFAELIARLSRHKLIEPYRPNDDRRAYDLEWCAFFLQEMVAARGIDVLLHARVVGASQERGFVRWLSVATTGGLIEFKPRFVIDASGACQVAMLTGFPVEHEGANRQLPMSLYFTLWDTKAKVVPILPEGCPRWEHDDEIPMTSLHRFPTGKVEVKMKVVGFDAADAVDRSAAEIFARRQMHGLIYYLQTVGYRGIALDTHVLASVSRSIGIREERRIVGEHRLSEAEARSGVIFADAVAVNTYHIDFHWPDRMERAGTGITDMIDPHHLPLRMMIPRGARNLLVPGRGASGDQTAMSAYRVMAVVAQMGYAAGHAARQCVETGTDLRGIDLPRLQSAIQAGGQSLDLSDYGEYLRNDLFTCESVRPEPWPGKPRGVVELVQLSNGRLLAVWVVADGVWLAERRERQWQPPRPLVESPPFSPATIRLRRNGDGGLHLELRNAGGARWNAKSIDDGLTWKSVPPDKEETGAGAAPSGGLQVVLMVRENADGTLEACIRQTLQDGQDRREVIGSPIVLTGGGAAMAVLDDGSIALVFRGPDDHGIAALSVAISTDRGETWIGRRAIEAPGGAAREPKVIATRTGLAVLAVDDDRLFFWHGSTDRILHGPPPAASHALHA